MLGFHVLDARDNTLLRTIFEFTKFDPASFQGAMQAEGRYLRQQLGARGVEYNDLKSSLVPTNRGVQAVFLYDWLDDPSWNYAVAFSEMYLPRLRKTLRTSVLHGDLLEVRRRMPVRDLDAGLVRPRQRDVCWSTVYAVYFNNLRPADLNHLHESLSHEQRYLGYIDVTFGSTIRNYIATTVSPMWVMLDRNIILNHGSDDFLGSDEDPVGYDLERHGYNVVGLPDPYFTGFLSYKIEAIDAPRSHEDKILNLAAVTGQYVDLDSVGISVPNDKVEKYLLRDENKLRLMTSIGLQQVTSNELAALVQVKLSQSYIYDLRFAEQDTPLFAVSAEFTKPDGESARRLLALKYDKVANVIGLVSVY